MSDIITMVMHSLRTLLILSVLLSAAPIIAQEQTLTGKLRELTQTSVTLVDQNLLLEPGALRTYSRTKSTQLENCEEANVRPGAEIVVTIAPDDNGDTVASRIYFYSCRELAGMVATVVAVDPPTVTIRSERYDSPFPRGEDVVVTTSGATQISTCRNEALDLSTLEVGWNVNVYGQITTDGNGIDATYLATADDCPQTTTFNCVVVGISDTSITVDVDGYGEVEAWFPLGYGGRDTAMVYLDQCNYMPISWSEVQVGDSAQGTFQIAPRGPTEVYQLTILRDCPDGLDFGFARRAVIGMVEEITDDEIAILTPLGRTAVIAVGDTTVFADCTGRPFDRTNVNVGDDVYAVVDRVSDTLRASLVIRTSGCNIEYVTGVIEREGLDEMSVRLENGRTLTFLLDEECTVIDCAGQLRAANDPALRERSASFLINAASDPVVVSSINVNLDCPGITSISGTITGVTDDMMTVRTDMDSVFLVRTSTTLLDSVGYVLEWDETLVGELVCGEVASIGPSISAAYLYVGMDCTGMTTPRPIVARGIVVRNDLTDIVIDGPDGLIDFAATEATSVQGAPTRLSIEPGTIVEIEAGSKKQSLQPIATMVRVDRATSVDEDGDAVATPTMLAYPQPATDLVSFTDLVAPGSRVMLITLDGREVASTTGRTLNVSSLVSGSYMLVCTISDGTVRVQPLMIVH